MPRRGYMPPARPASAAEGAAQIRDFAVKLFDRQDGHGVDWRTIDEILFRAAFDVLDKLPDDEKRAVARRVHAGAYDRASGGCADGPKAGQMMAEPDARPANAGMVKGARPRPPR